MAEFFNASYAEIPALGQPSGVNLVTSTSDSTIILSILVANRDGSSSADITALHTNASDVIQNYLGITVAVPADANVDLIGNKYILPSGDKLKLDSSTSGVLDGVVSYVVV